VADVYQSARRPRRRWGRRLLITLLVLLVLLAIALTVLDRFAASYAEREIAARVAREVASQEARSDPPEVKVEGVPFLTQVAAGEYRQITILLRDFSAPAANGRNVEMPLLDIRANDVRAPLDTLRTGSGDIVAGTVTGTGTIDYASVAALSGREGVRLTERNGKLAVTAPLSAVGQTFMVNGTANLTVKGNVVQVRFDQLTAEGLPALPLVQNLLDSYAKQISVDLRIPALPLKLAVQKVQPRPEGLVVTAGADEVPLNTGGL
jgi:hypothetical protein